ncbi:MAG TPA: hypothetical protein VL527_18155 [Dongiaceae bacterium]|nr:hypothetical protein [Dongiaceae bacterium]
MRKTILALAVCGVLALALTGCETRSISDSGYRGEYYGRPYGSGENPLYKGELSEMDILGAAPKAEATEENIHKAFESAQMAALKRGDKLMLIQSGAMVPDDAMLEEANHYFAIAPFSGVPPTDKNGLAGSLRLRAAQGGYRFILCYWGVLESAQRDQEGKAVSWVPIVGGLVPDQKQQMRIRLKGLLLDVLTGNWKMYTPESYSDEKYNSSWNREARDQQLVLALKQKGYRALLDAVLTQ